MFTQADAQSPWQRRPNYGFRCVKLDSPATAAAAATIEPTFRDYSKEAPVSEEVFEAYRGLNAYDKTQLHARMDETETTQIWVREKVSVDAAYANERMRNVSPPYQVPVYFPGGNAFYDKFDLSVIEDSLRFLPKSGRALVFPSTKASTSGGTT